jgi:hypothetical protein
MTFKLFGYLISIEKLRRNKAVIPTGEPTEKSLIYRVTTVPKRAVYNPAKDISRIRDGKVFSYFK